MREGFRAADWSLAPAFPLDGAVPLKTDGSLPAKPDSSLPGQMDGAVPQLDGATYPPDATVPPSGPTFYVALNGNNSNDGSAAHPWRSINHGVAQLSPGDTLVVRDGTYKETMVIGVSGTKSKRITVRAEHRGKAILDGGWDGSYWPSYPNGSTLPGQSRYTGLVAIKGNHVTLDGFQVLRSDGRGIQLISTTGVHLLHCRVQTSATQGISFNDSSDGRIDSCEVTDTARCGHYLFTKDSSGKAVPNHPSVVTMRNSNNLVVTNCLVHDNYGEGLMIESMSKNIIVDACVTYNNWACECYVHRTQNTVVRNSVFFNTQAFANAHGRRFGILITDENQMAGDQRSRNVKIYNNLVVNTIYGVRVRSSTKAQASLDSFYIAHNTIVNCEKNWGIAQATPAAVNTVIENNLSYSGASWSSPGTAVAQPGVTCRNNIWSQNPGPVLLGQGSLVATPQLKDPNGVVDVALKPANYELLPGSPGENAGHSTGIVTKDHAGRPRGQLPDCGFHEANPG